MSLEIVLLLIKKYKKMSIVAFYVKIQFYSYPTLIILSQCNYNLKKFKVFNNYWSLQGCDYYAIIILNEHFLT